MKISLDVIRARSDQLNRELDLKIAQQCSKAPPTFFPKYIVPSRSSCIKRSFERLVAAGVLTPVGGQYRFDQAKYQEFKK